MKNLKTMFIALMGILIANSCLAQGNAFDKYIIDSTETYDFRDTLVCGPGDSLFDRHGASFGFGANDSFAVAFSKSDTIETFRGDTTICEIRRFGQYHKGYEVMYYGAVVTTIDNRVRNVHSSWLDSLDLSDTVNVSEEVASGTALTYFDWSDSIILAWQDTSWENYIKELEGDTSASWKPEGRLVYCDKYGTSDTPVLCWYFKGMLALDTGSRVESFDVYVDAKEDTLFFGYSAANKCSGDVGHCQTFYNGAQANLQLDKVITQYRLKNCQDNVETRNGQSAGDYVKKWKNTDKVKNGTNNFGTNDQFATSVHWAANWAHDYFDNHYGLDGPQNQNHPIYIRANFSEGASFDPNFEKHSLFFGNALGDKFASLDVVGHEYAHMVTRFGMNLLTTGEAGAISESLSDIFGTAVERYAQGGTFDWDIMGDELGSPGLRNMQYGTVNSDWDDADAQNPQPTSFGGTNWVNPRVLSNDGGGIHHNCGVMNKVFQLLVDGGTHNGTTVESLGFSKTIHIFQASMWRFTSNVTFAGARTAMLGYVRVKYGSCSKEDEAVRAAWYSVNVGPTYAPCTSLGGWNNNWNRNQKMYVRISDITQLNLIAVADFGDVTSYSWNMPGVTYTDNDSAVAISGFPMVPAFYDLAVTVTTSSDTMSDTLRVYVINDVDPICQAGQFNKWIPSAINETKLDSEQIKIYPNPGTNELNIDVPKEMGLVNIDIISHTGAVVSKKRSVQGQTKFDVSRLPAGIYYVKAYNANRSVVVRYVNIKL